MTPLLLLHGATGTSRQVSALANQLKSSYRVFTLDFYGHGSQQGNNADFSIEGFARQVDAFLHQMKFDTIDIFGFSMGGYVAMYMARYNGFKGRIITLGTKFHWDEATAKKENNMLQPDVITTKVPSFAAHLAEVHGEEHWRSVLAKTASMLTAMGANNPLGDADYASINNACLIMLGDRDKMVTLEETIAVYRKLPSARLAVLPGMHHPIEQADSSMIAYHVTRFLI